MKVSKKHKRVKKLHKDCEFVDKWGRQFKSCGLHLMLYRSGNYTPLSWFSDEYPKKVWRIQND